MGRRNPETVGRTAHGIVASAAAWGGARVHPEALPLLHLSFSDYLSPQLGLHAVLGVLAAAAALCARRAFRSSAIFAFSAVESSGGRARTQNSVPTGTRICELCHDPAWSSAADPGSALQCGRALPWGFQPFRWRCLGAGATVGSIPTSPRRLFLPLGVGAVFCTTGCLATLPPPIAASASAETTGPTDFRGLEIWYRQPAKEWTEALPVGFRLTTAAATPAGAARGSSTSGRGSATARRPGDLQALGLQALRRSRVSLSLCRFLSP